jgi:uncharacterized protein
MPLVSALRSQRILTCEDNRVTGRILAEDLLSAELDHRPLPPAEVIADSPTAAVHQVGAFSGEVEVGIWEMTRGVARDTESEEIFIVLSGSGVVEFADGSQVELRPGTAVRLHEGEHTRWTVTERLRKVYIACS